MCRLSRRALGPREQGGRNETLSLGEPRGAGMTCRKEDAGISVPAVRNRRLVCGVAQVWTPRCDLPGPGACGRGAGPRLHRYSGPGVEWHRVPDRRGPRGPLFPLHVARFSCQARGEGGGRREGASCWPDVSALNDCRVGQSRAGVCWRRAEPPSLRSGRQPRGARRDAWGCGAPGAVTRQRSPLASLQKRSAERVALFFISQRVSGYKFLGRYRAVD